MKLTSLSILHSTPKENPWKISQLISLLSLFSILWKSWWISSFQAGRSPSEGQVEKGLWEWPNKNNPTCVIIVQCIPSYCLISISASISIYIYMLYLYLYIYICLCYLLTQYPEVKSLLAKKGCLRRNASPWTALNHPGNSSETLRCPHWRSSKSSKR